MLSVEEKFSFDDVLLQPGLSDLNLSDINLSVDLTDKLCLKLPFFSAAMDTISNAETAITMAKYGGIGIIHKNMSIKKQVAAVTQVKYERSWIINNPYTIYLNDSIDDAREKMDNNNISGLPVVEKHCNGDIRLVGIITRRDIKHSANGSVQSVMTPKDKLIIVDSHITMNDAKRILHSNRIEKLLVTMDNNNDCLSGLITMKDIDSYKIYPNANLDQHGRLLVGAAIGIGDSYSKRTLALIKAGVDLLILDSAHCHSIKAKHFIETFKSRIKIPLVVGNVCTPEAVRHLCSGSFKPDIIKIGVGAGSICTTRAITGVGYPQLSAILECSSIAKKYNITTIGDGGMRLSGDVAKALAAGASAVMLGNMIAGSDETPGEIIIKGGKQYKVYNGMGSLACQSSKNDRYAIGKTVPEGVEAAVPVKGPLNNVLKNIEGGLRASMGYIGALDIKALHEKARWIKMSSAGLTEGRVHDVYMTREPPNYR